MRAMLVRKAAGLIAVHQTVVATVGIKFLPDRKGDGIGEFHPGTYKHRLR